jgi:hypothetical protein
MQHGKRQIIEIRRQLALNFKLIVVVFREAMKKYLLILLSYSSVLMPGALTTVRAYKNYLFTITNNSSTTFKLYCSNNDWTTVLFSSDSQLELFTSKFDKPISELQKEYDFLMLQRNDLLSQLVVDDKTFDQAQLNPHIKELDGKIKILTEKLRPVIRPHSVTSKLPCRIFTPDDLLAELPEEKGFPQSSVRDKAVGTDTSNPILRLPQTALKGGGITIEIIDTDKTDGCKEGFIKVIARRTNPQKTTSLCVANTLYTGYLNLIIEEDGSLKLERLKTLPLE